MRLVDENRIEKVEMACVELMVQNGYGGASVAQMAKRAGVSKGYLYRFYKNKEDLVQSLLTRHINLILDHINTSLDQNCSLTEVITFLVHYLFKLGEENPEKAKFIYVLIHDYNFQFEKEQQEAIKQTIKRIYTTGIAQKSISETCREEEIFTILVIYPLDFMNLRFKNTFGLSHWQQEDIDRVISFCINTLKH